jgi:hypothetical protein
MENDMKKLLLASVSALVLFGSGADADYRQSGPGGIVNNFKSQVDTNSVHTPNVLLGGGTAVNASSANVANASAVSTIPAVAAKTAYLCGFTITSGGSTGAALVTPTVTGLLSGTMNFTYGTVAGVTLANAPLVVALPQCLPASAVNTAIAVTLPALGAGNTNATVNSWGYYL